MRRHAVQVTEDNVQELIGIHASLLARQEELEELTTRYPVEISFIHHGYVFEDKYDILWLIRELEFELEHFRLHGESVAFWARGRERGQKGFNRMYRYRVYRKTGEIHIGYESGGSRVFEEASWCVRRRLRRLAEERLAKRLRRGAPH